jgi:hypothetical protein
MLKKKFGGIKESEYLCKCMKQLFDDSNVLKSSCATLLGVVLGDFIL